MPERAPALAQLAHHLAGSGHDLELVVTIIRDNVATVRQRHGSERVGERVCATRAANEFYVRALALRRVCHRRWARRWPSSTPGGVASVQHVLEWNQRLVDRSSSIAWRSVGLRRIGGRGRGRGRARALPRRHRSRRCSDGRRAPICNSQRTEDPGRSQRMYVS